MHTRLVLALGALLLLTFVACPVSTPTPDAGSTLVGGKAVQCQGSRQFEALTQMGGSTACTTCKNAECLAEAQAVSGVDPMAFGGACKDNLSCRCTCHDGGECSTMCLPSYGTTCQRAVGQWDVCLRKACGSVCQIPPLVGFYDAGPAFNDAGPLYDECLNGNTTGHACCTNLTRCCQAVPDSTLRHTCENNFDSASGSDSICKTFLPTWVARCPGADPRVTGQDPACDVDGGCCSAFADCCARISDPSWRTACQDEVTGAQANENTCWGRLVPWRGVCR